MCGKLGDVWYPGDVSLDMCAIQGMRAGMCVVYMGCELMEVWYLEDASRELCGIQGM